VSYRAPQDPLTVIKGSGGREERKGLRIKRGKGEGPQGGMEGGGMERKAERVGKRDGGPNLDICPKAPEFRGSVAEWLACWTQAQKGLGSNRSRDAVG